MQNNMIDRARALFEMAATNYNDTGELQAAIIFDLQNEAGKIRSKEISNQAGKNSRDALALWIRQQCKQTEGSYTVAAVYMINEGWSNRVDMLPDDILAAVNKYAGGPRNWPEHMRCEKIIVTGETPTRSVTVSGIIHPATRVVGAPEIFDGESMGRMSRFFEQDGSE